MSELEVSSGLKLPEELKGPWDHALILTYGADIPFFENALWRQFRDRCRNKIILADGQRYLEASANYARGGLVRHLNQKYVAEGVFAPRAAHAKLILLTNPERGRLLIGSGNLSWQGYASGGELFTRYEYSADSPDALNAFLAVRELIEGLTANRYVSKQAARRIRYLLENTPWLFQSPRNEWQPVRHNLGSSFLDQLQQAIGDQSVEELWAVSPFYDENAVALERVLNTLNPREATLLVQPGHASVDPTVLQDVLNRYKERCRVRAFSMGVESPYIHAKLYLIKLSNRAICLQGSPNLSQVAILLTVPQGNIEVANLLTGPRDAFDHILRALEIEPETTQLDTLDLKLQRPEPSDEEEASDGWRLISGEWQRDRLYLRFQGTLPYLEGASLAIANRAFPLEVHRREPHGLALKLSPEAAGLLERPVPVSIRWGEDDDALASNPIFVCNRAALDEILEVTDKRETLDRVGDLDLDDEEFERLLGELEAALVIDRRSVWQIAGRTPPSTPDEDDEALRLDYADVDYEMLRKHPKLQQYMRRGASGSHYARSRLQIILSSITDHFRGLLDASDHAELVDKAIDELDEIDAETEEEGEEQERERQQQRRSRAQRIGRILKNFVRRYLRGIRSPDFQELAGFEVMAQNYVIFTHILWKLFDPEKQEWVEPEFVVESLLKTWRFFWGDGEQAGYYRELAKEQQTEILELVREHRADAKLLAALYYGAYVTRIENWTDLRFALRDFWREMLCAPPFEVTDEILEDTWHTVADLIRFEPPQPTAIVDELAGLAEFETRDSFLRALEECYGYPSFSCTFGKQTVYRLPINREDTVDCLISRADQALSDEHTSIAVLRAWMRFQDLDYYRIQAPRTGRVLYYETLEQEGLYWASDQETELEFGSISPQITEWGEALSQIQSLAERLDTDLVLPRRRVPERLKSRQVRITKRVWSESSMV